MNRIFSRHKWLLIVLLLVPACACPGADEASDAFFDLPFVELLQTSQWGSPVQEGQEWAVHARVMQEHLVIGTSYYLTRVEMDVDSAVVFTTTLPAGTTDYLLQQTWKAQPGGHSITVLAYNDAGVQSSDSETVGVNASTPTPTSTPTQTPTTTPTITQTSTRLPPVELAFYADQQSLTRGECTTLHWRVTNVAQVFLDNQPVPLSGERQDCPTQLVTHLLHVITLDNQKVDRFASVQVVAPIIPIQVPPTETPRIPTATRTRTVTPQPTVTHTATPCLQKFCP